MIKTLQSTNPISNFPSWDTLTKQYGPFLGALVFFIIIVVILQWFWYNKNLKSKNQEIERSVKRVTELETLVNKLINQLRSKK